MSSEEINAMLAENIILKEKNKNLEGKLSDICLVKPLIVSGLKLLKTVWFFKKTEWKNRIDVAISTLNFICP